MAKTCPRCQLMNPSSATHCDCGYGFTDAETDDKPRSPYPETKSLLFHGYLARHYRGELSLAVSFWVNIVLLNLLLRPLAETVDESARLSDPDGRTLWGTSIAAVVGLGIWIWQVVGTWRAAWRTTSIWGGLTVVLIVLGVLGAAWSFLSGVVDGYQGVRD